MVPADRTSPQATEGTDLSLLKRFSSRTLLPRLSADQTWLLLEGSELSPGSNVSFQNRLRASCWGGEGDKDFKEAEGVTGHWQGRWWQRATIKKTPEDSPYLHIFSDVPSQGLASAYVPLKTCILPCQSGACSLIH